MPVSISLPESMLSNIHQHLFPNNDRREQGGFLFARFDEVGQVFDVLEWVPLTGTDYVHQERDYLELTDVTRAALIKKAHDMQASLIEIHCHPGQVKVAFSLADWMGFREFVPHVRWRLAKRPYAALVFGYECVDGLAWLGDQAVPIEINCLYSGSDRLVTTGNSIKYINKGAYGKI